MANTSSATKLINDVIYYEQSSDKIIPSDCYYIIKVIFKNEMEFQDLKLFLKTESSRQYDLTYPLSVCMIQNIFYIIFSSLENGNHWNKGSHHQICSDIVSRFCMEYKTNVKCSIIELDTRIKVLVYFQTKIYECARTKALDELSKTKKSKKNLYDLTLVEIVDQLENWDEIESFDKFGIFYKSLKQKKTKYSFMSEMINCDNIEKFRKYLFE